MKEGLGEDVRFQCNESVDGLAGELICSPDYRSFCDTVMQDQCRLDLSC